MRVALHWLCLLMLLTPLGCGYRPMGAAPASPQGAPAIAIPPFTNRSTEVGLEAIMASAMINAFAQTKAVKIAPRVEDADLILDGKIRSIDNTSVAYLDVTRSLVRRVTLRVEVELRRGKGGKVLWRDLMVLQEDYVVDPNYQAGEATRAEGLRRAAVNMARRVMDKVLLVI